MYTGNTRHSHLSAHVQPPIMNFLDNPVIMNGPRRTACFAKAMHNCTFSLWTIRISHWVIVLRPNPDYCKAMTVRCWTWTDGQTDGQRKAVLSFGRLWKAFEKQFCSSSGMLVGWPFLWGQRGHCCCALGWNHWRPHPMCQSSLHGKFVLLYHFCSSSYSYIKRSSTGKFLTKSQPTFILHGWRHYA